MCARPRVFVDDAGGAVVPWCRGAVVPWCPRRGSTGEPHERVERRPLPLHEAVAGLVGREPACSVELGERLPTARAWRPLDLERVAPPLVRVEVGLPGE